MFAQPDGALEQQPAAIHPDQSAAQLAQPAAQLAQPSQSPAKHPSFVAHKVCAEQMHNALMQSHHLTREQQIEGMTDMMGSYVNTIELHAVQKLTKTNKMLVIGINATNEKYQDQQEVCANLMEENAQLKAQMAVMYQHYLQFVKTSQGHVTQQVNNRWEPGPNGPAF